MDREIFYAVIAALAVWKVGAFAWSAAYHWWQFRKYGSATLHPVPDLTPPPMCTCKTCNTQHYKLPPVCACTECGQKHRQGFGLMGSLIARVPDDGEV